MVRSALDSMFQRDSVERGRLDLEWKPATRGQPSLSPGERLPAKCPPGSPLLVRAGQQAARAGSAEARRSGCPAGDWGGSVTGLGPVRFGERRKQGQSHLWRVWLN